MSPPRSAFGASPPGGRRWRPGEAGSAAAAWGLALGAPLLAVWWGNVDRRLLLTLALLWYAAGHLLSALMPNCAELLPVRALPMLGAAVFTPQALLALNTSAIYLGPAVGAATGGAMVSATGFEVLHEVALAFMLLALGLSIWLGSRMRTQVAHG